MKKVAILYNKILKNAQEDELDVLKQVNAVSVSLRKSGYIVHKIPFTLDLSTVKKSIMMIKPLFVFNLVESVDGKDDLNFLAAALLQSESIPFTGSSAEALLLTTNKIYTKKQLRLNNLKTPNWFSLGELGKLNRRYKYIIKPISTEGSSGLDEDSVFKGNEIEFLRDFKEERKNNESYFIERFIEGREFNISILGGKKRPRVLPAAEIKFIDYPKGKPRVVGYKAKWHKESFEYKNTKRSFIFKSSDSKLVSQMNIICLKCWELFGLKGYVRIDFRVDKNKTPFILEINANPCISPDSGFVAASAIAGLSYDEMIKNIIDDIN